jgi:ribosomal protein S18 acetylase RimI-like enzyme
VIVRPIALGDAHAVGVLVTALGYPANDSEMRRRIRAMAMSRSGGAYVAIAEDEVVGVVAFEFCRMLHLAKPVARITTLVVRQDLRGRTIGKALVEKIFATAKTARCCGIEVTSNKKRRRALGFYKRNGFRNTSNRLFRPLE